MFLSSHRTNRVHSMGKHNSLSITTQKVITVFSRGKHEWSNDSCGFCFLSGPDLVGTEGNLLDALGGDENIQGGLNCRCNKGSPKEFWGAVSGGPGLTSNTLSGFINTEEACRGVKYISKFACWGVSLRTASALFMVSALWWLGFEWHGEVGCTILCDRGGWQESDNPQASFGWAWGLKGTSGILPRGKERGLNSRLGWKWSRGNPLPGVTALAGGISCGALWTAAGVNSSWRPVSPAGARENEVGSKFGDAPVCPLILGWPSNWHKGILPCAMSWKKNSNI